MAAPISMTAQTLNALKGWGANLHAVDYECGLDSSVTARVPAGSVVHVDPTSAKLKLGVGTRAVMPMFTFSASDDPDVQNQYPQNADTAYATTASNGQPVAAKGGYVPINPSGVLVSLVAVGAYELVSTNFYLGASEVFAPQDHLTSPVTNGNGTSNGSAGAAAGQLCIGFAGGVAASNGSKYSICGVVSRAVNSDGPVDNGYGSKAVAFWPVYLPSSL